MRLLSHALLILIVALMPVASHSAVSGDFEIDFSGIADTNPYVNDDFIKADPSSTARIASGVFRSVNNNTPAAFLLDPEKWVPGDVLTVKIELSTADGGADGINAGFRDANGNGYEFRIHGWGIQRRRNDLGAEAAGGADAWDATRAMSDGDVVVVSYDKTNGAISVTVNDTAITELNGTFTTHADKDLMPYFGPWPGNDGAGGIISLAVDGVTGPGGGDPEITATKLIFGSQPGNITVGQTFPTFTVLAVDDDEQLDEEFDGDVTVALQVGDGSLFGTLTQAAVAGVASFGDVGTNTLNTDAVIRATSDGLTYADSEEFDVTAGTGGGFTVHPLSGGPIQR